MNWLEEILIVLAYSTKTQLAIALGVLAFFLTLATGQYLTATLVFPGLLAPIADAIRPILMHKYEKAAWLLLGSFLLLAYKCFKRDRKKLMSF